MKRLLDPIARRVMLLVNRALVRMIDDSGDLQRVQVTLLAAEPRDHIERVQQYGVSSHPHPGAEAVVVCVGGSRDHPIVIAIDDRRYRVRGLRPGEVVLFDDLGHLIHLTREGIVIDGAGQPVTIKNAPRVRMETDLLEVTGEIKDRCDGDGKTMSGMRSVFNSHDHPGDSGGTTGAPNQAM